MTSLPRRELALASVCAGLLMVEICLTRIFSIVLWYHFGFLAVSTALLGFAASGVWLSLKARSEDAAQADSRIARSGACAALAIVLSLWLMTESSFDAYSIVQERTIGVLCAFVLWVTLPFFFLGLVVSRTLAAYPDRVGPLYAYDLCGSALGCCGSVFVLSLGFSAQAVVLVGATLVGLGALLFAGRAFSAWPMALLGIAVPAGFLLGSDPQAAFPLLAPKSKPYHEVEKFDEIMRQRQKPTWRRGELRLADGKTLEVELPLDPKAQADLYDQNAKTLTLATDDGPRVLSGADLPKNADGSPRFEFHETTWTPFRRWSSLSRVDAFHRPAVFGSYGLWGLSDRHGKDGATPAPRQKGITIDAWAMTSIMRYSGAPLWPPGKPEVDAERKKLEVLEYLPAGSVHRIVKEAKSILCIGAGGGLDLLTAKYFGCKRITGVEINKHVIAANKQGFSEFAGHLYDRARHAEIDVQCAEGRHFLERSQEKYDVVQLSGVDTYSSSEAGTFALSENYLYTVEAFKAYLAHLRPGGVLTLTRWFVPHRDKSRVKGSDPGIDYETISPEALRLLALTRAGLEGGGVAAPQGSVFFLASQGFTVILVKPEGFTPQEVDGLHAHCERYAFQVLYSPRAPTPVLALPGFQKPIANFLQELMDAKDARAWLAKSEFDVQAPVDDRPFYFEWSRFRHILDADHYTNVLGGLTAHGTLMILFLEVLLLGFFFVVAPLLRMRDETRLMAPPRTKLGVLIYFTSIGYGFICVEIILSQKFVLFLGHPIHALATILFSLLLFSGIGAALSQRFPWPKLATLAVAVFALMPALLFDAVFARFLHLDLAMRVLIAVALMAPVGLLMGIPFPAGIRVLARVKPELIPWAWGINGYTSVVGSVLSVILGIEFGFRAVLLSAAAVYAVGVVGYWLLDARPASRE